MGSEFCKLGPTAVNLLVNNKRKSLTLFCFTNDSTLTEQCYCVIVYGHEQTGMGHDDIFALRYRRSRDFPE